MLVTADCHAVVARNMCQSGGANIGNEVSCLTDGDNSSLDLARHDGTPTNKVLLPASEHML